MGVFLDLLGLVLIASDMKDLGKVDRPHHWQLGAMILLMSWLE